MAALTTTAFATARVPPLLGRGLLDSDDMPGAPTAVVLGYDLWQRTFGGRQDVVGTLLKLGNTSATVIGVMPKGLAYPVNYTAWTPLSLRASYGAMLSLLPALNATRTSLQSHLATRGTGGAR